MCFQNSATAKQTLQQWATQNDITPADFAKATGYSYNHAYQLLRGEARVSEALVGRLLFAFGQEVAKAVATALYQEPKQHNSSSSPAYAAESPDQAE